MLISYGLINDFTKTNLVIIVIVMSYRRQNLISRKDMSYEFFFCMMKVISFFLNFMNVIALSTSSILNKSFLKRFYSNIFLS